MLFKIYSTEKYKKISGIFRILLTFIVILFIVDCTGLRLTNMTAPVIQDPREDMKFYCEFDMGGEELYAVKWYKDDHEFFRYIPARNPNLMEFQVMGVNVDSRRTNCAQTSCTLFVNNLSRTFSSGAYRCEVSSEAPAFRLASQTHNVTIAVLPKDNPRIEGLGGSYLIGDVLNATCISGLGDPKPLITWYIDQQPVNSKFIRDLPQYSIHEEAGMKLQKSSSELRFPLDREVTKNRDTISLEIACVQSVEGLNPAIAPSKIIKKTIIVSTEDHIVKNQKLYGFFSYAVKNKGNLFMISPLIVLMKF